MSIKKPSNRNYGLYSPIHIPMSAEDRASYREGVQGIAKVVRELSPYAVKYKTAQIDKIHPKVEKSNLMRNDVQTKLKSYVTNKFTPYWKEVGKTGKSTYCISDDYISVAMYKSLLHSELEKWAEKPLKFWYVIDVVGLTVGIELYYPSEAGKTARNHWTEITFTRNTDVIFVSQFYSLLTTSRTGVLCREHCMASLCDFLSSIMVKPQEAPPEMPPSIAKHVDEFKASTARVTAGYVAYP